MKVVICGLSHILNSCWISFDRGTMFEFRFVRDGNVFNQKCETLAQAERYSRELPCDIWAILKEEGYIPSGSGLYKVPKMVLIKSSGDE